MATGAQNFGAQLGQIIFGGGDDNKAYYQGQALGAQVADRMASARKSRADAMIGEDRLDARQGINPDALTTAGYSPNQAALLGSILRSNDTVDLGKLGVLQAPTAGGALASAADAVRLGDMTTANNNLALASGKPLETTSVSDGTAYNKYAATTQPLVTTALGDAAIDLRHAQAGASNASAHLSDVRAASGGFSPHSGGAADSGAAEDLLTPEAQSLISAALSHGYTIPLPNFGFGARGAAAKAGALNALAKSFKDQGASPDDAVSSMINGKTATMGLGDIARSSAKVNAWENSASQQADIALELSNKVDRTGIPVFNKWLLAGRQGTGDETVAQFNNANNTLAEEYARVMGGGNSTATDSTRQLAHTMINSAMTQDQYDGTISLMKREMATRKGALHESTLQQRQGIVAPAGATAAEPQQNAAQPAAPARGGYQLGQIIMHNGKQYRVTGGDPNDPDVEPLQ